MLKEIFNTTYQNFYVNEDNIIVGIETPKSKWKIKEPLELKKHYEDTIIRCQERLKSMGNYEPLKAKLSKHEKMLKQLDKAISKLTQN